MLKSRVSVTNSSYRLPSPFFDVTIDSDRLTKNYAFVKEVKFENTAEKLMVDTKFDITMDPFSVFYNFFYNSGECETYTIAALPAVVARDLEPHFHTRMVNNLDEMISGPCPEERININNILFNYQWLYHKMCALPLPEVLCDFEDAAKNIHH